jgi:hypothetical protein
MDLGTRNFLIRNQKDYSLEHFTIIFAHDSTDDAFKQLNL